MLPVMATRIDPELERLSSAEERAHARFLRLEGFGDSKVVEAAQMLWQDAAAALRKYCEQANAAGRGRL
jgi:hypothetical protein